MTFTELVATAESSGVVVAILGLMGFVLQVYAWRVRVRDVRLHRDALAAAANDPAKRAVIEANPPPSLGDQALRLAVAIYLAGMTAAVSRPAYEFVVALRRSSESHTTLEWEVSSSRWTDGKNPFDIPPEESRGLR